MSQPADSYATMHTRIIENDPTAPSELAEFALPDIVRYLRKQFKTKYPSTYTLDEADTWDAATQTYFDYVTEPIKYNPTKSGLLNYLQMAAWRDLQNILAKKYRRQLRHVPLESVELVLEDGNTSIEEQFIQQEEATGRIVHFREWQNQRVELAADNELDNRLLELLNRGERRNSEYARVLAITHLPLAEQNKIVKRHKDRLKVRLKRRSEPAARPKAKEKKP
jgi:hypothetical protein